MHSIQRPDEADNSDLVEPVGIRYWLHSLAYQGLVCDTQNELLSYTNSETTSGRLQLMGTLACQLIAGENTRILERNTIEIGS